MQTESALKKKGEIEFKSRLFTCERDKNSVLYGIVQIMTVVFHFSSFTYTWHWQVSNFKMLNYLLLLILFNTVLKTHPAQ